MTRLWPEGTPIEVTASPLGQPLQFRWRAQTHQVDAITRHWRVNIDWWQSPIWRDYYKLTTVTGLLVVIYHDLHQDAWFLQRLYD